MRPVNLGRPDLSELVGEFWKRRLTHHTNDYYRGRALCKMPEDLRTYQHIIEESQPDVILEFGSYGGGSAVWFADQLDALCAGSVFPWSHVVTVDWGEINPSMTDPRVAVIRGDLDLDETEEAVRRAVGSRRVFAVDDSAHTLETTRAVLRRYADLVPKGSWFIVEDGVVDDPGLSIWANRGVQQAITEFLATAEGSRFVQHDLAFYGLTTDHTGWLEAVR